MNSSNQQIPPPAAGGKIFVQALRTGRMANRIVGFANLIAFAAEHGHRVVNVTFHSYAHLFETTSRDVYCRFPVPQRRSVWDVIPGAARVIRDSRMFYHAIRSAAVLNDRHSIFGRKAVTLRESTRQPFTLLNDPEIQERIRAADIVFIYGWGFVAPECVPKQAETIRAFFRPVAQYNLASRQVVEQMRQDADVVIGVHIRHGDYKDWNGGKCYFPAARYAAWMHELVEQFPGRKVSFLVCSNEPRSAEEFPGLRVRFGTDPVVDLYALSHCDFLLGPISSFSQWASFYGNKPLFHLDDTNARVELGRFQVAGLHKIL
jgi:hypothetical protein